MDRKVTPMNNVTILFGSEGIKNAYKMCLQQLSLDIVCLSDEYAKVIGSFFDTEVAPKLYGKIQTREILPDSSGNRKAALTKNSSMNSVRYLPLLTSSESDYLLSENQAVFITFGATPFALLLSEQELVRNLKIQFEALWNKLG